MICLISLLGHCVACACEPHYATTAIANIIKHHDGNHYRYVEIYMQEGIPVANEPWTGSILFFRTKSDVIYCGVLATFEI